MATNLKGLMIQLSLRKAISIILMVLLMVVDDDNTRYLLTDSVPSSIVKECFSTPLSISSVLLSVSLLLLLRSLPFFSSFVPFFPPPPLLLLLLSPPLSLFHSSTFQQVFGSQGGIFWFCNTEVTFHSNLCIPASLNCFLVDISPFFWLLCLIVLYI